MFFSPVEIVDIVLIGFAAGVVIAIMGASGSLVVVPGLTLALSTEIHHAMGIALMLNFVAALVAAYVYYRHRNIYIRPALWIAGGTVVGAQVGGFFADMIPAMGMSKLFGFFLIPFGISLWRRGIRGGVGLTEDPSNTSMPTLLSWNKRLLAVGLGLLVGLMCGLFASGGGIVVIFILIYVLRYPLHLAVGTAILIIAANTASGSVSYGLHGNIDILDIWTTLIAAGPTLLAAGLGARLANVVSEATLGKLMGTIFILLGIAMIITQ